MLGHGKAAQEERLRRGCALMIQCAYRRHLARVKMNARYRATYTKLFDESEQSYLYKHKVKLHLDDMKPRFARYCEIPTPRKNGEKAPEDYNPGTEDTSGGCLLIVTSNTFPIGKWNEVSEIPTNADHEQLKYLLTHEFIGKFQPEKVNVLKNPSTNEFKDVMKSLRHQCKTSGFLVVYLATHIVTVIKGEKENPKEVGYIAFHNSVWGKNTDIAETCISLSSFCGMLNKITCKRKTIIVNYAHQPKPRALLFPSTKIQYPPSNFLSSLADGAQCVVIGPCAIGSPSKEYFSHSEHHLNEILAEEEASASVAGSGAGPDSNTTNNNNNISKSHRFFRRKHNPDKENYNKLLGKLINEWGLKPLPEVTRSPRPPAPMAVWNRVEGQIEVVLPDQKEVPNTHWCMHVHTKSPFEIRKMIGVSSVFVVTGIFICYVVVLICEYKS
jgi:hypothetical protein